MGEQLSTPIPIVYINKSLKRRNKNVKSIRNETRIANEIYLLKIGMEISESNGFMKGGSFGMGRKWILVEKSRMFALRLDQSVENRSRFVIPHFATLFRFKTHT